MVKCCVLRECPQCGLLARHSNSLASGGYGPGATAVVACKAQDPMRRRSSVLSPTDRVDLGSFRGCDIGATGPLLTYARLRMLQRRNAVKPSLGVVGLSVP